MIVEHGKVVSVDFELRDAQDELIQPHGGDPIVYLHGSQDEVFQKIQDVLEGKSVGDEITVQLEPHEAFGEFDPELMRMEDEENFAEELAIGVQLEEIPVEDESLPDVSANPDNTGFERTWTVTDIADGQVILDGNHPFAGMALRYALRIIDIRDATEEEKAMGAAAQSLFSVSHTEAGQLN